MQEPSRGRSRSQSSPLTYEEGLAEDLKVAARSSSSRHTFAIMILSARLFEISFAISIGEVSHDVPFRSLPSGRVTIISCLGCSVGTSVCILPSYGVVTHLISSPCSSPWLRRRWHCGLRRTREVERAVRRISLCRKVDGCLCSPPTESHSHPSSPSSPSSPTFSDPWQQEKRSRWMRTGVMQD